MKTPKTKQEIQKIYSKLKIKVRKDITLILDLSQGKISEHSKVGHKFYMSFVTCNYADMPTSTSVVRDKLQQAWWIERDDLKQYLAMIIFKYKLSSKTPLIFCAISSMRDYILKQRLFLRQKDWQTEYSFVSKNTTGHSELDLSILVDSQNDELNKLNLFNRYLVYLSCILDLSRSQLQEVLLSSSRQVNRYQIKLANQMKEIEC